MNDVHTQITVRPEVEAFVAEVRAHLVDLTDDEREELLGGLEADLSDQLADGADPAVLGDPALYAAELRAAAGLPAPTRRRRIPRPNAATAAATLDGARGWWVRQTQRHAATRAAWQVVAALQPAWWVLRAWAAVTLIDILAGPWEYVSVIPTLAVPLLGETLLVVAVVGSVVLGLGRAWPRGGAGSPLTGRLVLLALNLAAVAGLPLVADHLPGRVLTAGHAYAADEYHSGWRDARRDLGSGLRLDGKPVTNVFAYDAAGRPLQGVQLYTVDGEPLAIAPKATRSGRGDERTVGCGWVNGTQQLFHVFPLAERQQSRGTCLDDATGRGAGPAELPPPPYEQVPPARTPVDPAPTPSASASPSPGGSPSTPAQPRP